MFDIRAQSDLYFDINSPLLVKGNKKLIHSIKGRDLKLINLHKALSEAPLFLSLICVGPRNCCQAMVPHTVLMNHTHPQRLSFHILFLKMYLLPSTHLASSFMYCKFLFLSCETSVLVTSRYVSIKALTVLDSLTTEANNISESLEHSLWDSTAPRASQGVSCVQEHQDGSLLNNSTWPDHSLCDAYYYCCKKHLKYIISQ